MRLLIVALLLAISYAQTDIQRFFDNGGKSRLLSTTLRSKVLRRWGVTLTGASTAEVSTELAFTFSIHMDSACFTDPVFETEQPITSGGLETCVEISTNAYELLTCVEPGVISSQLYFDSECSGPMDAESRLVYGDCDEQVSVTWGEELGCLPEIPDPVVGEDFTIENGMEFCEFDSNGCITDGPDDYGADEVCTIRVNRDGVLDVQQLQTEVNYYDDTGYTDCYDFLFINGVSYCGRLPAAVPGDPVYTGVNGDPNGLSVSNGDEIRWFTDENNEDDGFVVCLVPRVGGCVFTGYAYDAQETMTLNEIEGLVLSGEASPESCQSACADEPSCLSLWYYGSGCKFYNVDITTAESGVYTSDAMGTVYVKGECIAPCEDDDERAIAEAANRGRTIEGCSVAVDFTKGINLCNSGMWGALVKEICPRTCGMCG